MNPFLNFHPCLLISQTKQGAPISASGQITGEGQRSGEHIGQQHQHCTQKNAYRQDFSLIEHDPEPCQMRHQQAKKGHGARDANAGSHQKQYQNIES